MERSAKVLKRIQYKAGQAGAEEDDGCDLMPVSAARALAC